MKILELESTTSTSDAVCELLNQGVSDTLVCAEIQTSGRGTNGRRWSSPRGNLYMSFPAYHSPHNTSILAYATCCSLHRSIMDIFSDIRNLMIKPPNDILINGKKLSGILIENFHENLYIIGIGVNLQFAPLDTSVAIKDISNHPIDKLLFVSHFLNIFFEQIQAPHEQTKHYYYKYSI